MALLDRCVFLPVLAGLVDFVVSAAVPGFMTPAQAGGVNGATYHYVASSADNSQWEIGNGTYSGTTLARTSVLFSSASGAKVNFNSAPTVAIDAISVDFQTFNPATSSLGVATYDGVNISGKTGIKFSNSDNTALTATEHYSVWIGATSQGTGDPTPAGQTAALGISAIKANWMTTSIPGEFTGINIAARGGHNNSMASGDTAAILCNTAVSFSNNFACAMEAVTNYFPGGSNVSPSILSVDVQIGSLLPSSGGGSSNGFFCGANNGVIGTAFLANNIGKSVNTPYGTGGFWTAFLNYIYDDGTNTPYSAFFVNQTGWLRLAGPGAPGTNQKTYRVSGNIFQMLNSAENAVIFSVDNSGNISVGANQVVGARVTGWNAPTTGGGAVSRGTFDTGASSLVTAETLAALITDLRVHGIIGT